MQSNPTYVSRPVERSGAVGRGLGRRDLWAGLPRFALVTGLTLAAATLLLVGAPSSSSAGYPLYAPSGPETQLNDFSPNPHRFVTLAANGQNQNLWVWDGQGATDSQGIFGRLTSDWTEFRINEDTAGAQRRPSADWSPNGQWVVVVWHDDSGRIVLRQFDVSGNPLTGDVVLATGDHSVLVRPTVRHTPTGKIVVAWQENRDDGTSVIHARGFLPNGAPGSDVVSVSLDTTNLKQTMAMQIAPNGKILICWSEREESMIFRIHMTVLEPDLTVSVLDASGFGPNGGQSEPDLVYTEDSSFLLVWSQFHCYVQEVGLDAQPIGTWAQVDDITGPCENPCIDRAPDGTYVVAWKDADISVRPLDENGLPVGASFQYLTGGEIYWLDMSFTFGDNFYTCWDGDSNHGGSIDVFTLGYARITTSVDPSGAGGDAGLETWTAPSVFRDQTEIAYRSLAAGSVSVEVFDGAGRSVRRLQDAEYVTEGTHRTPWDGRDDFGRSVPTGTYFYSVTSPSGRATGRVVRVR